MGASDTYAASAVLMSALALLLALVYLARVIRSYRRWRDLRAQVSLAKALGLAVIALGLTISAAGLTLTTTGVLTDAAILATAGLSMARGALLVLIVTLVLAGVRPGGDTD